MTVSFSSDELQTQKFAQTMAQTLEKGSFIALYGDLGAGKTAFTKGIARGLGIKDTITSPTFTILSVYEGGRLPLYHFDVYRISGDEELFELDFDEYAFGDGICVCEWADNIKEMLPKRRIDVFIERTEENERKITVVEVDDEDIGH